MPEVSFLALLRRLSARAISYPLSLDFLVSFVKFDMRTRAYFVMLFLLSLRIYVFGQVSTEYISEETPIPSYYSLHLALERLRTLASEGQSTSPRVLLIGEEESGKTSLMKTLANWAIRSGRARTEREVPVGEMADEGEGKSRGVLLVNLDTSEVRSHSLFDNIVLMTRLAYREPSPCPAH